jgi:hypothetical protein
MARVSRHALALEAARMDGCDYRAVRRFVDDDKGYLAWLAEHPGGYVVNLLRLGSSGPLMLHRATCSTIRGTPSRGSRWTADWIKLCGDREQLERIGEGQGRSVRLCGTCMHAPSGGGAASVASRSVVQPESAAPLSIEPAPPWSGGSPGRYRRPEVDPVELPMAPRLASWNKAGDPEQIRLGRYLDAVEELLRPSIAALPDPLALRLDVGLPDHVDLLNARDLDNYLYPLASRLTARTGRPFVSVWGTKQHGRQSWVRVGQALLEPEIATVDASAVAITTASPQTETYKQQVHDQLAHLTLIRPGPVRVEIAFELSARRNWMNLWKPTIDALTPILGRTRPDRDWHPLDGRIVELGLHLHRRTDARIDITVAVAGSPFRGGSGHGR